MSDANHSSPLADIREESEGDNNLDSAGESEAVMKDLLFLIHGDAPNRDSTGALDVSVIHQPDGQPPDTIVAGYDADNVQAQVSLSF